MTKIVFFDIDGTLLDKKRRIPASAKLAILELKKQGIIPAIATGRPPFLIKEILEELAIDTHISLNGQYVVHKGEIVYQNPMEAHLVERLAQATEINKQGIAFARLRNDSRKFTNYNRKPQMAEKIKSNFAFQSTDFFNKCGF